MNQANPYASAACLTRPVIAVTAQGSHCCRGIAAATRSYGLDVFQRPARIMSPPISIVLDLCKV
jgi:hypothetical protein